MSSHTVVAQPPLNSPDDLEVIANIHAPTGGMMWLQLEFEDVERFRKDPDGFAAEACGLSKAEYREWNEVHGHMLCCELTTKGKECRGRVAKRYASSGYRYQYRTYAEAAAYWKSFHRQYPCELHERKAEVAA